MTLAFLKAPGAVVQHPSVSDDDRVVSFLAKLSQGRQAQPDEIGFVAGVLVATQSQRIRDAAALTLADMSARDAGGSILEVLRRPELVRASGTLLYALAELGVAIDLDTLVRIVLDGSYEGRAMALQLLEDGLVDMQGGHDLDAAKANLLQIASRSEESEAVEAARAALALLPNPDFAAE